MDESKKQRSIARYRSFGAAKTASNREVNY
jgi:hypothetical protein